MINYFYIILKKLQHEFPVLTICLGDASAHIPYGSPDTHNTDSLRSGQGLGEVPQDTEVTPEVLEEGGLPLSSGGLAAEPQAGLGRGRGDTENQT